MAKKDDEQKRLEESLGEARREIARLKRELREADRKIPASSGHVEERLAAIEVEVRSTRATANQIAYKMKRLAKSKMVSETAAKMQDPGAGAPAFNCLNGLESCLENQRTGWGRALCYVLFVRCVIGG